MFTYQCGPFSQCGYDSDNVSRDEQIAFLEWKEKVLEARLSKIREVKEAITSKKEKVTSAQSES